MQVQRSENPLGVLGHKMDRQRSDPHYPKEGLAALSDKSLVCRECGAEFIFSEGEQDFYQKRGLLNEPSRCPECRAARRRTQGYEGGGGSRPMYPIVCASCGKEAEVPFQPRLGRPVYCNECFSSERSPR